MNFQNKRIKFYINSIVIVYLLFLKNSQAITFKEAISKAKAESKIIEIEKNRIQILKQQQDFGYTQFLPNIKASYDYSQRNSYYDGQPYDRSNKQIIKEIKIEQPLFDGFATVIKIKQDHHLFNVQKNNIKDKTNQILLRLVKTYCELFKYQEINKIQDNNQKLYNEIAKLVKQQKSLKYIDNSAFVAVGIEQELFLQKNNELKFKLKKAQREFQELFADNDFDLDEPKVEIEEINLLKNQGKLLQNPLLKSSFNNYLASKDEYSLQKTNYLPKITISGVITKQQNVVYLNNQNLSSRGVYLNFSIPIFQSGIEYLNLVNAYKKISLSRAQYQQLKNDVEYELDQAIYDYEISLNQKNSCLKIVELSQKNFNYSQQKYSLKFIDRISYLRAQIENNNILINCYENNANLVLAYYKIKAINGEIEDVF